MTRAHARLLGPCFKTGPESTQSYSAADRREQSLSGNTDANSQSASRSAQVRRTNNRLRLRRAERELVAALRLTSTVEQSAGTSRVRKTAETDERAPPQASDRHPTGRDVLLEEKCTRSTKAAHARSDRRERQPSPSGTRTTSSRAESPRSNFRVSQVYP
jgi:hypothetical protein